jgi:predicted Zn finger-like uncharacterized protein
MAEPATLKCPHCSASFKLPEKPAGGKAKCPACQQEFSPIEPAAAESPPRRSQPARQLPVGVQITLAAVCGGIIGWTARGVVTDFWPHRAAEHATFSLPPPEYDPGPEDAKPKPSLPPAVKPSPPSEVYSANGWIKQKSVALKGMTVHVVFRTDDNPALASHYDKELDATDYYNEDHFDPDRSLEYRAVFRVKGKQSLPLDSLIYCEAKCVGLSTADRFVIFEIVKVLDTRPAKGARPEAMSEWAKELREADKSKKP